MITVQLFIPNATASRIAMQDLVIRSLYESKTRAFVVDHHESNARNSDGNLTSYAIIYHDVVDGTPIELAQTLKKQGFCVQVLSSSTF